MNLLLFFVSLAIGAALAWSGVHFLQRTQRRTLHCITPYVPAAQRQTLSVSATPPAPAAPKP